MQRVEQDLYEILLRNLKEAVFFADAEGRIRIFNAVAEQYFELRGERIIGRKWKRAIPYRNIRRQLAAIYETQKAHHDVELAIESPSHSSAGDDKRLLRSSFYPIFNQAGSFIGCLATFGDVTEKGRLSREISKSRDLSTIGALARWMAHEIRNPLSSLNINIELLREELLDQAQLNQRDEILSLISFISYETLRLENNLKSFLDFNRLPPPKLEWVEVNGVLDSVVRLLGAEAQMKNARIETHLQKKLPLFKIDVSQFSLALSNLLINSIQAITDRGEIHVTTRASKKNLFVVIEDNGVGIPKEQLPKIFDFMFSTKPTGSGLGLSIARKIISDHRGEIGVKSEPGRGSTFRIRIPIEARPL